MQSHPPAKEFRNWITEFRKRALKNGISTQTYDQTMHGIGYDKQVVENDRRQPEQNQTIWGYLDRAVSDKRIFGCKTALRDNFQMLDRIVKAYGVPAEIVVAIWGMESNFGTIRGDFSVVQSLATLAFDGRRASLFETELLAALKIIQASKASADNMIGSWAGAMGHTQFMPSSFLNQAIDFDGDGIPNIWGDDPCDALASTAAYLDAAGWCGDNPVALEVTLDAKFNYGFTGLGTSHTGLDWANLGVVSEAIFDGNSSVIVPAGALGPAFMVSDNFQALLSYNSAISYALAVSHLADRASGGGVFKTNWPRSEVAMTRFERREFQERLSAQGFDTKGADGVIGPNTFAALRRYQEQNNLISDGYPTLDLLLQLRKLGSY